MGQGMVSEQFISNSRRVSKSAYDNSQWSVIWLGSETGLEQVSDDLKWPSGNGENARSDDKYEF
jgi:hypothetical protein